MANLDLWDSVSTTDPAHTKHVNQRGGFTAIDAYYQIRCATEKFGPAGQGWGWSASYSFEAGLVIAQVELWWETTAQAISTVGAAALANSRGAADHDAPKKALTDAITKGLSYLGFCADVFLGEFDGNKYTAKPAGAPARQPEATTEVPFAGNGGEPEWIDEALRFGKFKGQSWRHMAEGAANGERHGWLRWLADQDPNEGDPKYRKSNQFRQKQAIWAINQIMAKAAAPQQAEAPAEMSSSPWDDEEVPF